VTLAISRTVERVNGLPALADVKPLHLEPRCRICRNDTVRAAVNEMLATGATYAMIVRQVNDPDADPRDRVTIDSVRNHTARHFPVQNVARATYREILEQRAQANGVDFVNSLATALTPMAFLETVMAKGYQTLVDPDTKVDVNTAMTAASRLQALVDARAGQPDMLKVAVQLGRIINAVRTTVPEEMWAEIIEKLDDDGVCAKLVADTDDDEYVDDDDLPIEPDCPPELDDDINCIRRSSTGAIRKR
jgi:predicted RNA-binding protein YlqC (UPF0109 family)